MKKWDWWCQSSWLSENHKKFFGFFTVFWGDLEGAGWFSPPCSQATSRSPALLGLRKTVSTLCSQYTFTATVPSTSLNNVVTFSDTNTIRKIRDKFQLHFKQVFFMRAGHLRFEILSQSCRRNFWRLSWLIARVSQLYAIKLDSYLISNKYWIIILF